MNEKTILFKTEIDEHNARVAFIRSKGWEQKLEHYPLLWTKGRNHRPLNEAFIIERDIESKDQQ